jgi:uncharacterized protein
MAERTGGTADFLSRVFDVSSRDVSQEESRWTRRDYIQAICDGGYPEALSLTSALARRAWYDSYLMAIISRDISEFAEIGKATAIPRLLSLVAARSGSSAVVADLARSADLDRTTTRNYLTYLGIVFLTAEVAPWSTNLTKRLSKTPKVFLTDSGLAAHLLGVSAADLSRVGHPALGGLLETFVFTELLKLRTVSQVPVSIWQLREGQDREIDFVLEGPGGAVVAIEVKATASPGSDTARHLRWFKERIGDRFRAGIVLHLGSRSSSFGDGIVAMPVSAL